MHVGAPGRPSRSAGRAAESSGGAKPVYGQQVLDHHELPEGFQGCSRTLTERIIVTKNVPVLFILLTFHLPKVRSDLIGSEHASHLGDKPGQLSREVGMSGGSAGEIHQLLAHKIVKGRFEPEAHPDHLSRLALLGPNVMCSPSIHRPLPL